MTRVKPKVPPQRSNLTYLSGMPTFVRQWDQCSIAYRSVARRGKWVTKVPWGRKARTGKSDSDPLEIPLVCRSEAQVWVRGTIVKRGTYAITRWCDEVLVAVRNSLIKAVLIVETKVQLVRGARDVNAVKNSAKTTDVVCGQCLTSCLSGRVGLVSRIAVTLRAFVTAVTLFAAKYRSIATFYAQVSGWYFLHTTSGDLRGMHWPFTPAVPMVHLHSVLQNSVPSHSSPASAMPLPQKVSTRRIMLPVDRSLAMTITSDPLTIIRGP